MDTNGLRWIQTKNYKNLRIENPLEFHNLNVLIGPNGSGKSNFINLCHFLKQCVTETDPTRGVTSFEDAIQALGNTRVLDGTVQSPATISIDMGLASGAEGMDLALKLGLLVQTEQRGVIINEEVLTMNNLTASQDYSNLYEFHTSARGEGKYYGADYRDFYNSKVMSLDNIPTNELMLLAIERQLDIPGHSNIETPILNQVRRRLLDKIRQWQFYNANHMDMAEIRRATPRIGRRDRYLSENGTNLAAVLYNLQREDRQFSERINQAMRSILPATDSVQPAIFGANTFSIEWFWQDVPEPFYIHDLSDGTIRMLCWATLLHSPQLPSLIVIEEPEIGIHVAWLSTLADWIKSASLKTQVILSTHSPTLLDQFTDSPENVFVFHPADNDKVHFSISPLNQERLHFFTRPFSATYLSKKDACWN